jgi:hypothetical protein
MLLCNLQASQRLQQLACAYTANSTRVVRKKREKERKKDEEKFSYIFPLILLVRQRQKEAKFKLA